MEIIIRGTGRYAIEFVDYIQCFNQIAGKEHIVVKYFLDQHPQHDQFLGCEVKSIFDFSDQEIIVVAVDYKIFYKEIKPELEKAGLGENKNFVHMSQFFSRIIESKLYTNKQKYLRYKQLISQIPPSAIEGQLLDVYYYLGKYALALKKNFAEYQDVEYLLVLYQSGYYCKEILTLLEENILERCEDNLQLNFQKNVDYLSYPLKTVFSIYSSESIPVVFFPLRAENYILFVKKNDGLYSSWADGIPPYYKLLWKMMKKDYKNKIPYSIVHGIEHEVKQREIGILKKQMLKSLVNRDFSVDFLSKIEKFNQYEPFTLDFFIMMGRFFYQKKEYSMAIDYIENGLKNNVLNQTLCRLMAKSLLELRKFDEAIRYYVLSFDRKMIEFQGISNNKERLIFHGCLKKQIMKCLQEAKKIDAIYGDSVLKQIAEAVTPIRTFPLKKSCQEDVNGNFILFTDSCVGDEITQGKEKFLVSFYCDDVYTDVLFRDARMLAYKKTGLQLASKCYYDIIAMEKVYEFHKNKINEKYLLPFISLEGNQQIKFLYKDKEYQYEKNNKLSYCNLNRWKCNYLKIKDKIDIISQKGFFVGKPILLKDDNKKPKIILNIILDALSADKLDGNANLMQNTKRFFDKGINFSQAYSPAEWTYPSIMSINTGSYPVHTQMFHPKAPIYLNSSYKTIAENMNKSGYYCINFSSVFCHLFYADGYRGFHRHIGEDNVSAIDYIAESLDFMTTLDEKPLFISLHLNDIHDAAYAQNNRLGCATHLDLETILNIDGEDEKVKSVDLPYSQIRNSSYEKSIENIDKVLNIIWSYLEKNYNDDEFLVALYADHGHHIVGAEQSTMKSGITHVPLMLRGKGIPSKGVITNELVSTIDLYKIYEYCVAYEVENTLDCRLPKALGGEGREYTVSNSIYPGQTYKMAINTMNYEFRLETFSKVHNDGTVPVFPFHYKIFQRSNNFKRVYSKILADKFIGLAQEHMKRLNRKNGNM